jgi:hypothetical protein
MGGSGGGGISSGERMKLEELAKQKLKDAAVTSRHLFISFAFENEDEVNLLRGQAANDKTALQFDDFSLREAIKSNNEDYIKQKIRERIDRASVTVVYLTNETAQSRWVDWEIAESMRRGKGVIGVHKGDTPPSRLPQAFVQNRLSVVRWNHQEMMNAIEAVSKKR